VRCLDKSLACHALMEVLCWKHRAKAPPHRDFHPSLTASLPRCMTLAKSLVAWLAAAPASWKSGQRAPRASAAPRKRKQMLLLLCLNICQAQSSIVPKAGPAGVAPGGRCTSAWAAAPTPSPSSPRFPTPSSADRCPSHQA